MAPLAAFASLEASWDMVWQSVSPPSRAGTLPIQVLLTNKGPDNAGEIVVEAQQGSVRVPFEIPAETKKSQIVYLPWGKVYEDPTLAVRHRFGSQSITLPTTARPQAPQEFAVIGDRIGDFVFMGIGELNSKPAGVFPALTGRAPERASAYLPFDGVILAEGAERISDAAAAAIKAYVLSGGRLYIFGGSNSLVVNDPRWADIMPLTGARSEQAQAGLTFSNDASSIPGATKMSYQADGPMSWLSGARKPGSLALSEGGRTVANLGYHGQGMVIVAAWNPAEQPMRSWKKRSDFTLGFIRRFVASDFNNLAALARTTTDENSNVLDNSLMALSTYNSVPPVATAAGAASGASIEDPFQIRPPSAGVVIGLLIAYWFCLIPLHFGVLKKLDKRNWAWVTAPLIAVGFAGIFFTFASSLYASGQARTQKGLLAARAGEQLGYAYSQQDLFFPSSGKADLQLAGVETAWEPQSPYQVVASGIGSMPQPLVDTGTVSGRDLHVNTISFRKFAFTQPVSLGQGFTAKVSKRTTGGNIEYTVEVTNGTPYSLDSQQLSFPPNLGWVGPPIGPFKPGETKRTTFQLPQAYGDAWSVIPLYMQGPVDGLKVGATSGTLLPRNDRMVAVVHLANLEPSR